MKSQIFMILCGSAVASATAPCTPSPTNDLMTEDNSEYPTPAPSTFDDPMPNGLDSDKDYDTLMNIEDGLPAAENTVPVVPVPTTFDDIMPADIEDDSPKIPCSKEDSPLSLDENADADIMDDQADIATTSEYGASLNPQEQGAGPMDSDATEEMDITDCSKGGSPLSLDETADNVPTTDADIMDDQADIATNNDYGASLNPQEQGAATGPMGSAAIQEGDITDGSATKTENGAATGPMGSADQLTEGGFTDSAATDNAYGAAIDSGFDTQDPMTEGGDFTDGAATDNAYGAMTPVPTSLR